MSITNAANSPAPTAGMMLQEATLAADEIVSAAVLTVPAKNAKKPACWILVATAPRGRKPQMGHEYGPRMFLFCSAC